MARIAHLSDLHLLSGAAEQTAILDALVAALAEQRVRGSFDLIAITGDVFDDGAVDADRAARAFRELHGRMMRALGGDVPLVIVPGNHDRRKMGLFGPHRAALFDALAKEMNDRAFVHGCSLPFLSEVVEPSFHGLPLWIVAYDSSYLPRGWLSAGGMIRQEDLLWAAARIGERNPDDPIVLLLHHHLVPTPLTDLHMVEAHQTPRVLRYALERVLPRVFAHADREELTMTALGAGTALSTLHSLGRAVLVLHGHKHYATARCLDATLKNQGDVLIISAGSAGTAQEWARTELRDTARLWPSFNVIQLDDDGLCAHTVSFGWKGRSQGHQDPRILVKARRDGRHWRIEPVDPDEVGDPRLSLNRAFYELVGSQAAGRWDYRCEREVRSTASSRPSRYAETVVGEAGASLTLVGRAGTPSPLPTELTLSFDEPTRYRVQGGIYRTLDLRHDDEADRYPPFASLSLMNRYESELAMLEIDGLGDLSQRAFATVTDLGNGLEQPIAFRVEGGRAIARCAPCPARTLLRVYWPLEARS